MGKEIVYCGGCGRSIREDDFARGKALHVDHRPFCTECKPVTDSRPNQNQTSSRLAALTKTSSGRYAPYTGGPHPSTTRRRRREKESSMTPLLIGTGAVAAVIVLILFALSGSPSPNDPPAPPPPTTAAPPKAAPRPPAPPSDADKAAAAARDLEAFAISADNAIAILQRCEEVRSIIQGTSHEPRLRAVEERAKETRRTRQLESSLEEVSKLRALDPRYERKEEVLRLLNATLAVAGLRRAEVEEIIRKYEVDSRTKAAPPPSPKPARPPIVPAGTFGPFDTDSHGAINNWLVLGPFANRNHAQGLYDHDLLLPELKHVPAAGLLMNTRETAKVRWTPVVATEGRLLFRQVEGLGPEWKTREPAIAFAACWVVAESDMDVKFRTNADRGFYLLMDEKRIRNQAAGHLLSENADVFNLKLSKGPHLLIFKIAAIDESFGLRFRVATPSGDRVPGLKIWNQPPVPRKVLFAESFDGGTVTFKDGEHVEGGVDGSKAYAIRSKAAWAEPFTTPVSAETTIRFKIKPQFDLAAFEIMLWSRKQKINCWYRVRNPKKGEWTAVEFKASAARGGYKMDGPGLEGEIPASISFYFDDRTPEKVVLLDDFEVLE